MKEEERKKPSIYRLEITEAQKRQIKLNAVMEGLTIKEYILRKTLGKGNIPV
jgi:hypothetical protein